MSDDDLTTVRAEIERYLAAERRRREDARLDLALRESDLRIARRDAAARAAALGAFLGGCLVGAVAAVLR